MTMFKRNHQNAIYILTHFVHDMDGFCPIKYNLFIDERLLYEIATRNKIQHVLFHFLLCPLCRKQIHIKFKAQLEELRFTKKLRLLLWSRERMILEEVLRKYDIYGILFKQHREKGEAGGFRIATGFDLDVLVRKEDVSIIVFEYTKMGYVQQKKGIQKEIQLINKKNGFEIDLHFLLAYPHYSQLDEKEYGAVQSVTNDLFFSIHSKSTHLVDLPTEWYIVVLFIRYWYNDLMTGLRDMHDILTLSEHFQNTNVWNSVFRRVIRYSLKNEFLFVLSVASATFKAPLPGSVRRAMPWWIFFMRSWVSPEDIAVFPPITKWHKKKYSRSVRVLFSRYAALKYILKLDARFVRIFTPRNVWNFSLFLLRKIKTFVIHYE